MGFVKNIKNSIDERSSISVNDITLLASATVGFVIGLVVCFVLIYDVTYDGKIDTDLLDLGIFLASGGAYIVGSGMPKAIVDSKIKSRSWQIEAEGEAEIEKRYGKGYGMKRGMNQYDNNGYDNNDYNGDEDPYIDKDA
jgi:hypothetical protein